MYNIAILIHVIIIIVFHFSFAIRNYYYYYYEWFWSKFKLEQFWTNNYSDFDLWLEHFIQVINHNYSRNVKCGGYWYFVIVSVIVIVKHLFSFIIMLKNSNGIEKNSKKKHNPVMLIMLAISNYNVRCLSRIRDQIMLIILPTIVIITLTNITIIIIIQMMIVIKIIEKKASSKLFNACFFFL